MVTTMQLIMHVPLFRVLLPGNVITTIEIFFPLLGFDMLSLVLDWENFFLNFDFDAMDAYTEDNIYFQIQDMGYDSPNSIILLSTLAIVLILYFLQIVFLIFLKIFIHCTENKYGGKILAQKIINRLFFGELIGLYIGAYFEFGIASILAI